MVLKNSLVTIIMATFNRAHFISEALESILQQTYANWECLIIDDGSTDNTEEVLQRFLLRDPRFIYQKRSSKYKKGLPGARNMGIDLAKGEAIIFIDDDDIVHPENLETNINILSSKDVRFCRYDKRPFSGNFQPEIQNYREKGYNISEVKLNDIDKMITGILPFASCTVMWEKECFASARFNEELQYAEEWELYSRILSLGFEGISIEKVLYFNRKHPNSNTGEFWAANASRRASKIKAVELVINNLQARNLLNEPLVHYFIQLGFFLKEFSIIKHVLKKSNAGFFKRAKYYWGFKFYPFIRPFFLFKAKFKKIK